MANYLERVIAAGTRTTPTATPAAIAPPSLPPSPSIDNLPAGTSRTESTGLPSQSPQPRQPLPTVTEFADSPAQTPAKSSLPQTDVAQAFPRAPASTRPAQTNPNHPEERDKSMANQARAQVGRQQPSGSRRSDSPWLTFARGANTIENADKAGVDSVPLSPSPANSASDAKPAPDVRRQNKQHASRQGNRAEEPQEQQRQEIQNQTRPDDSLRQPRTTMASVWPAASAPIPAPRPPSHGDSLNRITIGRVDVQVNNHPPTPAPRPVALAKVHSSFADALEARYLNRFPLKP
jgi:hypothetical protein